jgi:3'(2'), 5'-bisphosphate nucleotidase
MPFEKELAVALSAASAAGEYVRREYETFTPIPNAPASISTHVDHGAQEIILKRIRADFPADVLVAEERTATLADAPVGGERVWVVDPIDGTRGFAMKNGEFSVMIGLTLGGRVVLGVVLEPVLHRTTYAMEGGGCWVTTGEGEPVRCRVTGQSSLAGATLIQSRSRPGLPPKPVVRALGPAKVVETYSAGIKLAAVARGEAEVYVNDYTGIHDWDVCAGQILVEEAGGRVTLFDGEAVVYGAPSAKLRRGLVATNGHLHEETVRRLAKV